MKIDYLISSLRGGGAERVLTLLADGMHKKGYAIKVITFTKGSDYELPEHLDHIKLHHGKFPIQKIKALLNMLQYYWKKKNRPDFIISFITNMNLLAIIVAKIYGIKIIACEHNSHLYLDPPKKLTLFTRKHIYKYADYLTVLTAFDIDYYKKLGANVVVMPNPCTFLPRKSINLDKEKVIIAVGSLNRYHSKGFDNLLKIAPSFLKNYPDWRLKIVGTGDKGKPILEELAREYKVQDRVEFTGFRNDVGDLLYNSEIFILPSRAEGLPMVLLEAMSQGTACIAYDCKTGPSDIISNNKNGILVADQDHKAMINHMEKLLSDEELRYTLAQNGLKSLHQFNINTILNKWDDLFEKATD